jgi:tripartite-type tricarboxylate transporter receptor subunit TctC
MLRYLSCLGLLVSLTQAVEAQTVTPAAQALLGTLDKVVVSNGRAPLDRAAARGEGALVPAGLAVSAPMVLLGATTLQAADGTELVSWMKTRGRAVRVGHAGAWSASLECALQLQDALDTQLTLVPFASAAETLDKLKSGAVDVLCEAVPNVMVEIQGGGVQAYVLASDERLTALWDVATADQAGVPLFSATAWLGLYTDASNAAAAATALQSALSGDQQNGAQQKLSDEGWTAFAPPHRTAEAHKQQLASEAERRSARLGADGLPIAR